MLLPIFVCLFNCAPSVTVAIEAHGRAAPAAGTPVAIIPADPRISLTDPTYVLLAGIVARGLAAKGLQPAQTLEESRAVVAIGWRRGPSVTTTQVIPAAASPYLGRDAQLGGMRAYTNTSSAFMTVDGRQPLGAMLAPGTRDAHQETKQQVTVYPWTLELKGEDPKAMQGQPLWSLTASSDGPSEDPADIAPEIVVASLPFIGSETAQKNVRISPSDSSVKAIAAAKPAGAK